MTVARTRLGVFGPGQFKNTVLQLGEVAEDLLIFSRPDE